MKRWMATATPPLVVVVLLAGCGGSESELETSVVEYSDAYLSGDGDTAFGMMSERCRDRLSRDEVLAISGQAAEMYGQQELESFDADVEGDMARVTYTFPDSSLNQSGQPWVREDGWRFDGC